MRIVTWNCRIGGFRSKAQYVAQLRPDILAVQEAESLDGVLFLEGEIQPTFCERVPAGEGAKRGIALLSYTDTNLRPIDEEDRVYGFHRYEARGGDLSFQVVAAWTWDTGNKATTYKQTHVGLRSFADWIIQRPTVILGDFNDNASYRATNWADLLELIEPLGLVSAYHTYFSEEFGKESQPTHFHHGKEDSAWHLDYCFIPKAWLPHLKEVEVGRHKEWHKISDHVPLIVDLDL